MSEEDLREDQARRNAAEAHNKEHVNKHGPTRDPNKKEYCYWYEEANGNDLDSQYWAAKSRRRAHKEREEQNRSYFSWQSTDEDWRQKQYDQWDNKAKAAEKAAYKEWQENCRKDTQQREDEARWREEERREEEARRRHQWRPSSQERSWHDEDKRYWEQENQKYQERPRQQERQRQHVPMSNREKLNNAYTILGLTGSENFTTVKTAYRKLSLIHHPDKGGNEERFKEINNAYHLILDSL